jgi:hypothetical protein
MLTSLTSQWCPDGIGVSNADLGARCVFRVALNLNPDEGVEVVEVVATGVKVGFASLSVLEAVCV